MAKRDTTSEEVGVNGICFPDQGDAAFTCYMLRLHSDMKQESRGGHPCSDFRDSYVFLPGIMLKKMKFT